MIHPVPKPAKRPRARRATNSTLPAASSPIARKQILRSSGPKRSAAIGAGKPAKARKPMRQRTADKEKAAAKFAHDYGSKERIQWVKARPCAYCELLAKGAICGPTENAHTGRKPGKGLKSHYSTIAPLGRWHHHAYDNRLAPFNTQLQRRNVEILASNTQAAWLAHVARTGGSLPW